MTEKNVEVDWQSMLLPGEKGKDGDTEFVYIKGLRRLAKLKGIKRESHPFVNVAVLKRHDTGAEYPFVQASYQVEFNDGSVYSDVADAHQYNTDGVFSAYPTALAAVRAEARALRKALGITLVAKEELGANPDKVAGLKNEVTSAQLKVIANMMKTKGITNQMDIIKICSTRADVVGIEELTFSEAKAALKWLNEYKEKK
jgi:hypothetical protein